MSLPLCPSRSSLLLALIAFLGASPVLADSLPAAAVGSLLACRAIAAQASRLRCFDRTSAILARAAESAPPPAASAGAATTADSSSAGAASTKPAVSHPSPQQTFGLSAETILAHEVAAGKRPGSISSITARISALRPGPDGRVIYQLDDGQTWEELQINGYAPDVKAGDRVQISRGWLDSYWLQAPSGRGCKVRRLR